MIHTLLVILLTGCGGAQVEPTVTSTPTPAPIPTPLPTPIPTPEAVTVQVAPDGSGDYPSLEAAVNAIPAGSIIILEAGTYRLEDPLHIRKPLHLVGAGMDKTEIVSEAEGYVVHFDGAGPFVAEEITFRHAGETAADVVVVWGGEVKFARCRFTGAHETKERQRAGLRLAQSTTGKVHDCVAEENNSLGIAILSQAQPTLEANRCTTNRGGGIYYGDNAGGIARENECSRNWGGILVAAQAQPTLEENVCMDNEVAGIAYQDSAGGLALQNECARNFKGIVVAGEAHPELEGNICTDNEDSGIGYHEYASGLASQNECSRNLVGIFVAGQAQPVLEENICADNQRIGVLYVESAGGEARQNECSRNEIGFLIEGQAQPLLESNTCIANTAAGITYGSNAGGTARQNECAGNARYGLYIAATADPKLVDNDCHDNGEADILDERQ